MSSLLLTTLDTGNTAWMIMATILVLLMSIPGIALFYGGLVRQKNILSILMQTVFIVAVVSLIWVAFGYSWAFSTEYADSGNPLACVIGGFDKCFLHGIGLDAIMPTGIPELTFAMFQCMFALITPALILGAFAERVKFSGYVLFTILWVIIAYLPMAHWVWGGTPWLTDLGFTDFAGSACIHMVGGITAFIGAAMLGPRIGKYDKNGKPRPILGHNILIGALGVFILWFGWYGFNGAAATDTMQLSQIFATTTVAPAVATCTAMIYTWIRNGKPDVSMSLNGSLAGLVAVTAGCANVDVIGSFIIGAIAGVLVCVAVYFVEDKLKVDDPVGAVAVHGCNGIWGTIAVGLFDYKDGLFYGGGVHHLLIQLLGILCIAGWTIITMGIVFTVLKKTIGLRVTAQEEIEGLDSTEHGLESGYPDFVSRELH